MRKIHVRYNEFHTRSTRNFFRENFSISSGGGSSAGWEDVGQANATLNSIVCVPAVHDEFTLVNNTNENERPTRGGVMQMFEQ